MVKPGRGRNRRYLPFHGSQSIESKAEGGKNIHVQERPRQSQQESPKSNYRRIILLCRIWIIQRWPLVTVCQLIPSMSTGRGGSVGTRGAALARLGKWF